MSEAEEDLERFLSTKFCQMVKGVTINRYGDAFDWHYIYALNASLETDFYTEGKPRLFVLLKHRTCD